MTDAESFRSCIGDWEYGEFVPAFFARTLERQLAEAREELAGWKKLGGNLQDCAETLERIDAKVDQVADIMREKDRQLAEAKEAMQAAHKLLHSVRRDHSDGMNLAAYERIQKAINHLTP